MASWHGTILKSIDGFWSNLRRFSYHNRTALEVAFIFLYAVEQILLLGFTFTARSIAELGFIVSLFAIIVLTTFSLHKLVMESRIKLLEQEVSGLQGEKFLIGEKFNDLNRDYNKLFDKTASRDLNRERIS